VCSQCNPASKIVARGMAARENLSSGRIQKYFEEPKRFQMNLRLDGAGSGAGSARLFHDQLKGSGMNEVARGAGHRDCVGPCWSSLCGWRRAARIGATATGRAKRYENQDGRRAEQPPGTFRAFQPVQDQRSEQPRDEYRKNLPWKRRGSETKLSDWKSACIRRGRDGDS
jgi:hypothetical protein